MQPLLLVSYGAPERQEDVVPFLNNLFAGKNVPAERVAAAVQKYERLAARNQLRAIYSDSDEAEPGTAVQCSPLNSECRKLIEGIKRIDPDLPVYWGNLFWHPLLVDTVAEMARDGIERAVCFATSAFDSPSGNQRYTDTLESVRQIVGANAPILEKLPLPFEHPLFIEAQVDSLQQHSRPLSAAVLLFSAHSISLADSARCHYVEQLQSTCQKIVEKSGTPIPWELVYQSRSGLAEHWLGPDIKERINELATDGRVESVIVSPIGFFCENMETEYDLDMEVGEHCAKLGINFYRTRAVGTMPQICRMIVETTGSKR